MDLSVSDLGQAAQEHVNGTVKGAGTTTNGSGNNKFQEAVSAWRNIDMTHLMPSLDTTASDIVSHQRDSLLQRKELAQKTKDFRKLEDSSKLVEIKALLKAYQSFIDLLTNQSKATSSGFLKVYSLLSEAPDPYPLLEASIDSLVLSEETLPNITSENKSLQENVSKLTMQLESAEKKLEAEALIKRAIEENQDIRIKEVESSWAAVLEEKKNNWEAKEKSLEEKVESQERLMKEIKAGYEVSQRLDRSETGDDAGPKNSAMAAELQMMNSDLERTSMRLAEVESRNEQLRTELAQLASQSQTVSKSSVEESPSFVRLQSENSSLLRKIDATRAERDTQRRTLDAKLKALERQMANLQQDRDTLREKVQSWGDYEDVKRELEMLRSIELATGDDAESEDEEAVPSKKAANGSVVGAKGESLEQLLLARNKKLSNEMTILRVSHRDLQDRLDALQEERATAISDLEKSQALNAQLENDLLKVQKEASQAFQSSALSVAGTYTSRHPGAGSYGGSRRGARSSSPTSSIISGFDPHLASSSASLEAIRAGEPVGAGSGILPMITAQRDRFKARNVSLEEELSRSQSTISSLRHEMAALQKDNLSLYEKTRYISTYNRSGGGSTSSAASAYGSATNTLPVGASSSSTTSSGLALDRYRSAYEANISPFAAFRGRESARAYKRMSLPERIVFGVTRLVLATRTSRNFFAAYCVTLHVLVFAMLYWMSTVDIEKHVSGMSSGAAAAIVAGQGKEAHHGDWHQEGFEGHD